MSKPKSYRASSRARTKSAVREAARDVKEAVHPDSKSKRKGFSWLVALGAGAAVAWRSWKAGQEPAPDGRDNREAARLHAQLEREARHANAPALTAAGAARPANPQAEIENALARARSRPDGLAPIPPDSPPARPAEIAPKSGEHTLRDRGESANAPKVADKAAGSSLEYYKQLAKEFYKRFSEDEVTTRAAALAFVGVFSLVPLMLFAVLALGFVFRDPAEATKHVQNFVAQLLPGESATRAANEVLAQTHLVETAQDMSRHIGWPLLIGVGSLLWAGISLFVTAATPMNAAWDVTETRNFLKLRLTALSVLLGAGLVFVLSLGVSALPDVIRGLDWPLFGARGEVPAWASLLSFVLAIGLDVLMFVLIYKFLPNARVTWRAALFSGGITGLLWEAFKQGFGLYLAHFGGSDNKMYGALGGVVLLITWIYYSCIVLLSGAEVGKMYHEHQEEGGVAERAPRSD